MTQQQAIHSVETAEPSDSAWRQSAAMRQAELITEFLHDDNNDREPYGMGETARVYAAANAALSCELCATYGREHDSHCTD